MRSSHFCLKIISPLAFHSGSGRKSRCRWLQGQSDVTLECGHRHNQNLLRTTRRNLLLNEHIVDLFSILLCFLGYQLISVLISAKVCDSRKFLYWRFSRFVWFGLRAQTGFLECQWSQRDCDNRNQFRISRYSTKLAWLINNKLKFVLNNKIWLRWMKSCRNSIIIASSRRSCEVEISW